MTTKLTFTVSFDRLLNDMSAEELLKLKQAVETKLQSFAVLNKSVEDIQIGEVFTTRTFNVLRGFGISYLSELRNYSQDTLKKLRGAGPSVLKEILDIKIKYNLI